MASPPRRQGRGGGGDGEGGGGGGGGGDGGGGLPAAPIIWQFSVLWHLRPSKGDLDVEAVVWMFAQWRLPSDEVQ